MKFTWSQHHHHLSLISTAVLVLSTLFALPACVPQRHLSAQDVRPLHYSTGRLGATRVDGIRQALERSKDAPVRVLVAHGMIANAPHYSRLLQKNIADRLGLQPGVSSEATVIDRGYNVTVMSGPQPFDQRLPMSSSEIRRTSWVNEANPAAERVVFYEMLWAPIRDEVKNRFLGCFESRPLANREKCVPFSAAQPNTDGRTLVNGALKDDIMVGGFADAMMVLSPVGDVLRDATSRLPFA